IRYKEKKENTYTLFRILPHFAKSIGTPSHQHLIKTNGKFHKNRFDRIGRGNMLIYKFYRTSSIKKSA
ncbi:hypothetical protein, partial [Prevotella nigrescens]|uniref:hypothetical protein n=1 Tax=Prevotella nigrescens TaxID=28133 RepID=UPI00241C05BE